MAITLLIIQMITYCYLRFSNPLIRIPVHLHLTLFAHPLPLCPYETIIGFIIPLEDGATLQVIGSSG